MVGSTCQASIQSVCGWYVVCGRYMDGMWSIVLYMTGMWMVWFVSGQVCGWYVAMWLACSQYVVGMYLVCGQYVIGMWLVCDWYVVSM